MATQLGASALLGGVRVTQKAAPVHAGAVAQPAICLSGGEVKYTAVGRRKTATAKVYLVPGASRQVPRDTRICWWPMSAKWSLRAGGASPEAKACESRDAM